MEFLEQFGSLLRTLGAFSLILIFVRLKVPLFLSILAGAVFLGISFGLGLADICLAVLSGVIESSTIALCVVIILLLALSDLMMRSGRMERICEVFGSVLRRKAVAMAAMPALIGLMPMPGGALFSAPLVKSSAGGVEISGSRLSAINYWFRHVWEYFWPLYPGVILAISISGQNTVTFILYMLPASFFMIVSGLLIFRSTHPDLHVSSDKPPAGAKRQLLALTSSIWIIFLVWAVIRVSAWLIIQEGLGGFNKRISSGAMEYLDLFARYGSVAVGLMVSIIWTARGSGFSIRRTGRIFVSGKMYSLVAIVACVMIFKQMLGVSQAGEGIGQELRSAHVPVLVVLAVLPFIAGMVTGLAVGFVGISFPIVLPLVSEFSGAGQAGGSLMPFVMLAYVFGHIGQMLSPLHICHIVSNKFFDTSYGPVYRRIVPPVILVAILTSGLFALFRYAGL